MRKTLLSFLTASLRPGTATERQETPEPNLSLGKLKPGTSHAGGRSKSKTPGRRLAVPGITNHFQTLFLRRFPQVLICRHRSSEFVVIDLGWPEVLTSHRPTGH